MPDFISIPTHMMPQMFGLEIVEIGASMDQYQVKVPAYLFYFLQTLIPVSKMKGLSMSMAV